MSRKANKCSLLDASIDWFTVTFEDGLRRRFAEAKCERVMQALEKLGSTRAYTNRLGFVGDRVENFFFGRRGDSLMVIGSGEVAAAQGSFFLGLGTHVTRLDLAVTLRDEDIDRDWTSIALRQASMDGRIDSGLLKTHRIEGTPDGRTLYIGARSSDRYIRIYDKTAQSKGVWPQRSWRWELEYKRPRAGIVAARLLKSGASTAAVIDVVASALADVRVNLPYGDPPSGWTAKRPKVLTTDETRLRYTSRVIAPFLKGLVDSAGWDRVYEALEKAHLGHSHRKLPPRARNAP